MKSRLATTSACRRPSWLVLPLAVLALVFHATIGYAVVFNVPVSDASFEDATVNDLAVGQPTAWSFAPGNFNPVFDPQNGQFAGTTGDNVQGVLPDGGQIGLVEDTGGFDQTTLSQALGIPVQASTTYTLEFFVGDRADAFNTNYKVEFLAGNATLAEFTNPVTPTNGTFQFASVSHTADGTFAGEELGIRFTALDGGNQTFFDSVTVTGDGPTSPPPAITNVALGKPVVATATFPGFPTLFAPEFVVDGNPDDVNGSIWLAPDGSAPQSLTVDLGDTFDLSELRLLNTGNRGFLDRATGAFSIEVAGSDGIFSEAVATSVLQFHADGFQVIPVDLMDIQFIRFNMESIADPPGGLAVANGGGLNELQAFGFLSSLRPQAIPEPSSVLLGLIGGCLLLRRRRSSFFAS